jgi:hypothetical protein
VSNPWARAEGAKVETVIADSPMEQTVTQMVAASLLNIEVSSHYYNISQVTCFMESDNNLDRRDLA